MEIQIHPRSTRRDIVDQINSAILSGKGVVRLGRYRVMVESGIATDYVALDWHDTRNEYKTYSVDLVDEGPLECAESIYGLWVSGIHLQDKR